MFTIKYRTYELSKVQSPADCTSGPCYDEHEQIHGPFGLISKEQDDGYTVVHAHTGDNPGMTFGPNKNGEVAGQPRPRSTIWVMNEQGATIARYDL